MSYLHIINYFILLLYITMKTSKTVPVTIIDTRIKINPIAETVNDWWDGGGGGIEKIKTKIKEELIKILTQSE